jgi:hypothetical protein
MLSSNYAKKGVIGWGDNVTGCDILSLHICFKVII